MQHLFILIKVKHTVAELKAGSSVVCFSPIWIPSQIVAYCPQRELWKSIWLALLSDICSHPANICIHLAILQDFNRMLYPKSLTFLKTTCRVLGNKWEIEIILLPQWSVSTWMINTWWAKFTLQPWCPFTLQTCASNCLLDTSNEVRAKSISNSTCLKTEYWFPLSFFPLPHIPNSSCSSILEKKKTIFSSLLGSFLEICDSFLPTDAIHQQVLLFEAYICPESMSHRFHYFHPGSEHHHLLPSPY